MYTEIVDKYLENCYITKIDHKTEAEKGYIPHFPVVKMDRETTKTRYSGQKDKYSGNQSLNESIHQGSKLHSNLFDVLDTNR